ncbi:hypothetical protein V8F20_001666 [Naviculisporaceae sp. PSN 640]
MATNGTFPTNGISPSTPPEDVYRHPVIEQFYLSVFRSIAETRGCDTYQTIRRLITACPTAFRIYQVHRTEVLEQLFRSLIAQSPLWQLRRVQDMALCVACFSIRRAFNIPFKFAEIAAYIDVFRRRSGDAPVTREFQPPTEHIDMPLATPPFRLDKLSLLVGVISPITPFLVRVDNKVRYNPPRGLIFEYTGDSEEEKILKSYLLESELLLRVHGHGPGGYRIGMPTKQGWDEAVGAMVYDHFIADGLNKSWEDHPIGYGRVKEIRVDF